VRPHAVRLWASRPGDLDNVLPATIVRQVFLGAARDYMVELADHTQLRVVASAAENIAPGTSVWLHLPPERCRILSG
jgi:iron(III) transport system ATP-binding protein